MITIKLFAAAKQMVGSEITELQIREPVAVQDLKKELCRRYPQLNALISHVRFAVNGEYASDETIVDDNDEIALIPPVSGG